MASKGSSNSAGLRAVRSCTECKQAKLRCDSKIKFPNPCTRCQSRQLFCRVDATFQRTPARKKLEAMSRELEELRSKREKNEAATKPESGLEMSPCADESVSPESSQNDFELSVETVVLFDTFIESSTAIDSFRVFAELFLPQFPLISPISIENIYTHQPFLFWTVLIIVCSHLPGSPYDTLFAKLHHPYRRLLNREILDTPFPLHKIQALLFLCVWPLPVDSQPKDPSWLYVGIALQAARFMGLDREQPVPSLRSVGVASGTTTARINTWIGCFYVGTALALHLGLRTPIDSELDFVTIQAYLNRKTVSHEFAAHVKIQLIVSKFSNLLVHDVDEATSTSLMRLMDTELDSLNSSFTEEDNEDGNKLERHILVVKLHFYAFLITKFRRESVAREIMLKTGLSTAIRIIDISTQPLPGCGWGKGDPEWTRRSRTLPKHYYLGLAFATIFLIKFFHLNSAASKEERQSAACHIGLAQNVFKTCSIDPMDEYGRAARVFELLAQLTADRVDAMKVRLTNRMGVSIVLDAITTASELRGQPTEIGENQTLDEAKSGIFGQAGNVDPLQGVESFMNDRDFLGGFWDDTLMSMLDIQSIIPFSE